MRVLTITLASHTRNEGANEDWLVCVHFPRCCYWCYSMIGCRATNEMPESRRRSGSVYRRTRSGKCVASCDLPMLIVAKLFLPCLCKDSFVEARAPPLLVRAGRGLSYLRCLKVKRGVDQTKLINSFSYIKSKGYVLNLLKLSSTSNSVQLSKGNKNDLCWTYSHSVVHNTQFIW